MEQGLCRFFAVDGLGALDVVDAVNSDACEMFCGL